MNGELSPWLHEVRAGTGGRLVFFPPAGSSASAGWALLDAVPADWSLWSVQYPGRGPRLREPMAASVREIAEGCLPDLLDAAGRTVLFGHSFGAYTAYDTAQLLAARGRPAAGLLVAGISAPGMFSTMLSELSDELLIASLRRQGGTAPELLGDDELMELVLPALRADLRLGGEYVDDHGRRLRIPTAGLGGRDDATLSPEQLRTWRHVTDRWLGDRIGAGDHFFYLKDGSLIGETLRRHWPATPAEASA